MKLRRISHGETKQPIGWAHYCPACKSAHIFRVEEKPHWKFDGNLERPTFKPSMRVYTGGWKRSDGTLVPERTLCHYHLVAGQIRFLDDSPHELKGKTVALPDFPEGYAI